MTRCARRVMVEGVWIRSSQMIEECRSEPQKTKEDEDVGKMENR